MASVTICNLDVDVKRRLRVRAPAFSTVVPSSPRLWASSATRTPAAEGAEVWVSWSPADAALVAADLPR